MWAAVCTEHDGLDGLPCAVEEREGREGEARGRMERDGVGREREDS